MSSTLYLVHNGAYDTIVLERDGQVVSEWAVTREGLRDLIADGCEPDDWPVHDPDGLGKVTDWGTPVLSVSAEGLVILDSRLAANRADCYRVVWPADAGIRAEG